MHNIFMVSPMPKVERIPTGIKDLDGLIEGGFPKGSVILITGPPGSGKTIFGLNYLYNGVSRYKDKGYYVSLEMPVDDLYLQSSLFGWDMKKYKKDIDIVFVNSKYKVTGSNIFGQLMEAIKNSGANRVVIDSISSFLDFYLPQLIKSQPRIAKSDYNIAMRYAVSHILEELKKLDATVVLISEAAEADNNNYTRDGVSEYLCDGIFNLHYLGIGGSQSRTLEIPKMRLTKQQDGYYPYKITDKGIIIDKDEKSSVLLK